MPFRPIPETLTRTTLANMCVEYAKRLDAPGTALWLVPSATSKQTILNELLRHRRGIIAPNLLMFEEFAERLLGADIRSASETRWALHETITELSQKKSLPHHAAIVERRGFYSSVDGYFEELATHGIALRRAETALRASHGAKREDLARITKALDAKRPKGTAGWWYERFANAAEKMAEGLPGGFKRVRTVFVSGFRFFQPCERLLLDVMVKHVDEIRIAVFADPARTRPEIYDECKITWRSLLESPPTTPRKAKPAPKLDRPAGIAHLANNLFCEDISKQEDATGVRLIKAPGLVGECRLVARQIRKLLNHGIHAGKIVVTAGSPADFLEVFDDVCTDYRIPLYHEVEQPLHRNPAVRTLLKAARLAQTDWPFEEVTALLRSNYFRPSWDVAVGDMARHSEGLLRQLGEPRSREAYLKAANTWAHTPPPALEDEQAEVGRRKRKGELAHKCLPFLTRFFDLWKNLPAATTAAGFTEWMRGLADEIGLTKVASEREADRRALKSLWTLLEAWKTNSILPDAFWRGIDLLAAETTIPPALEREGNVSLLTAESAAEADCEVLFIAGLGEKSPLASIPVASILDGSDRVALRDHGAAVRDLEHEFPREQLLFLQLIARPTKELILSYPAVDSGGLDLLPGKYLREVLEAFTPDAIPVTHQRMLIENYLSQETLCDTEFRVQLADRMRGSPEDVAFPTGGLKSGVTRHLKNVKKLYEARFLEKTHNEFSGMFQADASLKRVAERFGSEKIFSPTALETYVACPFRFWLEQLMGLQELEEPGEEIEHTRRGQAYHRALARLHQDLRQRDPEMTLREVPESVTKELLGKMDAAIKEYIDRSPSDVSKMLWKLEGERLKRSVLNYREHWNKFLTTWHKESVAPVPELFEVDFGLPSSDDKPPLPPLTIKQGDIEAKFGGRIDRVDIAELPGGRIGFWIIDYKTGRKSSYVAKDVETLKKLQLPLYALAVQEVFFPEKQVRPLGFAYWLVTDEGIKWMLPDSKKPTLWFSKPEEWQTYVERLRSWVIQLVTMIRNAEFPLAPRSEDCTSTCAFGQVCRITQSRHVEKDWRLELPMLQANPETAFIAKT